MKNSVKRIILAVLFVLFAVNVPLSDALAVDFVVTFTVNDTTDAADVNPGNGVCDADPSLAITCTLRAAIQESNALAGANIINLPPGTYTLSIAGTGEDAAATGDLDITGDLTIRSNGANAVATTIVDGGNIDRIFDILGHSAPGGRAEVHFENFTIQHGKITTENAGGAGISAGYADLYLYGMVIRDNVITGSHSYKVGGGLLNQTPSDTEIRYTRFIGNSADRGGAIFSNTPLSIYSSTISNNQAVLGGGIVNYGKLGLTNTSISGNTASNNSGGLYIKYAAPDPLDRPLLRGVTVFGNSTNPTLGGGMTLATQTEVVLLNSIIANNIGGNCYIQGTAKFADGSYNLSSDNTCNLTETGDMENTDPKLGPLANNGGRTKTHLPLKGSPVIDAGLPPPLIPPGLETDQRGIHRPQGQRADIGAVEVESECSFFVIPIKTGNATAFCL